MPASWFVAWTRPNIEFEAVERLKREGFDAFCPAHRETKIVGGARRYWRGRERREVKIFPAFPRYILLTARERPWQAAERIDGITTVLRQTGKPEEAGTLPIAVVNMLRGPKGDGILSDVDLTIELIRQFVMGSGVKILSGPFEGHIGTVVGQEGRRLRILLSLFGRQTPKWIAERDVERVA